MAITHFTDTATNGAKVQIIGKAGELAKKLNAQ
jgi:hypothetical protein